MTKVHDLHRPENFDPSAYEYVGCFDFKGSDSPLAIVRALA